jgi:multidrug transporter EmrE-like cation transporter
MGLMLQKKERLGGKDLVFGLMVGIPNYFSSRFLLKALGYLPAIIVYPTYSVATISVVTLAGLVFFKEKLGRRQMAAIGIILAALVLLNV